jgi:hypothetical protein
LLQLYVDAPLALIVELDPAQIGDIVAEAVTLGKAVTVTVTFAVFEQPLLVPVTVYVVVPEGDTEYEELVPRLLLQLYVDAPVALMVELDPAHIGDTVADALTFGKAVTFTVTFAVFEQPELVPVTVYVVVEPGDTEYEEFEPRLLLQLYVDAPVALIVVLDPAQIGDTVADAETFGKAVTLTVTFAVFEQPELVPVTVYVVVEPGDTVYEEFEPRLLLQLYVDAPLALIVELDPAQIGDIVAEAVTLGKAVTVTVTFAVFEQPELVPVTVYVVVEPGDTEYDEFEPRLLLQLYVVAPLALMVVLFPAQIEVGDAETETVGIEFTVIVLETQVEISQDPSALT